VIPDTEKEPAMTEWSLCRWHGPPAALETALRALGWHGAGEEAMTGLDPRVGGFIPPAGEAARILDGLAYAAVVANAPLAVPNGLEETGPQLSSALLGSF
jgi:hypothetical protein